MPTDLLFSFVAGIFIVAILYSSVGHAGASGYIAVMSLLSLSPLVIKPTALALNILVASIASAQFIRSGHFSWRLFWPLALLAVPFAFIGGYINLPSHVFTALVGVILLYSSTRFLFGKQSDQQTREPDLVAALAAGAVIGLLSGLTGTSGGIFLTPLLLFMGWARAKQAAGVSALFILANSCAGLLGNLSSTRALPSYLPSLLLAAALGGLIGSYLGSRKLADTGIRRFLSVVLFTAGAKLILA